MKFIYQKDYSDINDSILKPSIRKIKAKKIMSIINDFSENNSLKNKICVDIGGSAGFTAKLMSPYVKKIYVVDTDKNALKFGKKNNFAKNIVYEQGDAMKLSFKDKSVDVLICNQVYEHVPSHALLIKEIYRVLKIGGFCYFGAGNRFALIEPHHKLPFLSWFPKLIANKYLYLTRGKKSYYENHLSYFGLRRLLKIFIVTDYTIKVIKNPAKYHAIDLIKQGSLVSRLPNYILELIKPILPGYIFVIKKNT